MKSIFKTLTILFLGSSIFISCEDTVIPTAGFTVDPEDITVYDEVTFTNTSTDANIYTWDFGDGTTSTEINPVHIYTEANTYTVILTAVNEDGQNESTQVITVNPPHNYYTIDNTEYVIDTDMFWYQSGMGGDPYIRLLTDVSGQDNPDLLKLYPIKGVNELPGTYTWDFEGSAGTYDAGYTANYAGMSFDWTAIGKTGSGNLVITELETGVYRIEAEDILMDKGYYDFAAGGVFIVEGSIIVDLSYIGVITPLAR